MDVAVEVGELETLQKKVYEYCSNMVAAVLGKRKREITIRTHFSSSGKLIGTSPILNFGPTISGCLKFPLVVVDPKNFSL